MVLCLENNNNTAKNIYINIANIDYTQKLCRKNVHSEIASKFHNCKI